jgi:hypothetical protein
MHRPGECRAKSDKAIICTWVFNTTGGSLLIVALLHTAGNAWDRS